VGTGWSVIRIDIGVVLQKITVQRTQVSGPFTRELFGLISIGTVENQTSRALTNLVNIGGSHLSSL